MVTREPIMESKTIKVYCLIIGSYSVGKTTLINRLNNLTAASVDKSVNEQIDTYSITTKINITRKSYGQLTETIIPMNDDEQKRKPRILVVEIVYLEFPGKQIYHNLLFEFIKKIDQQTSTQPVQMFIVGLFDVSNLSSLVILEHLLNLINKSGNKGNIDSHCRIMIANKIDLVDKRIISSQEGQAKAKMLKCRYMECTTRNDISMQELEQLIVDVVKSNQQQQTNGQQPHIPHVQQQREQQ